MVDIVQVGYGVCQNANNNTPLGITCDGLYHWYWAWGSYCGFGVVQGTVTGGGPIPERIGGALSSPPPTDDIYVIRHVDNGVETYEGYVNGALLTGTDANGNPATASIPATSICWDSDQTNRDTVWFGETFNRGDSMGGWTGSSKNHLDYTSARYSVDHGWVQPSPSFVSGNACLFNFESPPPVYSCTQSGSDRFYIDSNQ